MHPRWRTDHSAPHGSPNLPGERGLASTRQDFFHEPLPDLEQQLVAELEGASWAVVAFASADAAWCDWLYRNLNGYPVPPSLVDRVTPAGIPRPDCLSLFPDRRDPSFAERLPHVLEGSTYLIVVCSPAMAQARSIEEQIRAFKRSGGEERVLALVVDGSPDAGLGEQQRAAQCDWLPSWLRWRLEEEGFRAADPSEPRVIDARKGYRSLKQVRDSLLTALLDAEAAELERLGCYGRNVELASAPAPESEEGEEAMTTTVLANPSALPRVPRGSKFTISMAVVLIVVAVVFGVRSFREIMADEPASTLDFIPVTGVLAGHSSRVPEAEPVQEPVKPEAAPETAETTPAAAQSVPPAAAENAPPATAQNAPAATDPVTAPATGSSPEKPPAPANVPQISPVLAWATSQILPAGIHQPARNAALASLPPYVPQPPVNLPLTAPSEAGNPAAGGVPNGESDAVLLEEVHNLERRGDETMAARRTEDALDLYHTALMSAEEYAGRKSANANARFQVVKLMHKLGTLQLQNASTAEARATYTQARKILLQLKSQGQWSRELAKSLDQIESRLLSLPRD